jgi:hypothetical protein
MVQGKILLERAPPAQALELETQQAQEPVVRVMAKAAAKMDQGLPPKRQDAELELDRVPAAARELDRFPGSRFRAESTLLPISHLSKLKCQLPTT